MFKQAQAATGKKSLAAIKADGLFPCPWIIHRKPRECGHGMPAALPALPVRGQGSIDDGHRLPSFNQLQGEMVRKINRLIFEQANPLATTSLFVLRELIPRKFAGNVRRKRISPMKQGIW